MLFEKLNSGASIEAIQDAAQEISKYIYSTSNIPDTTLATYWCAKQAIVKGFGLCRNKKTKTKRIEYIRSMLHDNDIDVRIEAIGALINLIGFKAKPMLEIAFRSEKDEFVKSEYKDQFEELRIWKLYLNHLEEK